MTRELIEWNPRKTGRTARLMRFKAEHPECVDAAQIIRENPMHSLLGLTPERRAQHLREVAVSESGVG